VASGNLRSGGVNNGSIINERRAGMQRISGMAAAIAVMKKRGGEGIMAYGISVMAAWRSNVSNSIEKSIMAWRIACIAYQRMSVNSMAWRRAAQSSMKSLLSWRRKISMAADIETRENGMALSIKHGSGGMASAYQRSISGQRSAAAA